MWAKLRRQDEEIAHLKDEMAVLKGEKKSPKFKPSKLRVRGVIGYRRFVADGVNAPSPWLELKNQIY